MSCNVEAPHVHILFLHTFLSASSQFLYLVTTYPVERTTSQVLLDGATDNLEKNISRWNWVRKSFKL